MRKRALLVLVLVGFRGLSLVYVSALDGLPGVEDRFRYPNLHPIRWRVLLSLGPILIVAGTVWIWRADDY